MILRGKLHELEGFVADAPGVFTNEDSKNAHTPPLAMRRALAKPSDDIYTAACSDRAWQPRLQRFFVLDFWVRQHTYSLRRLLKFLHTTGSISPFGGRVFRGTSVGLPHRRRTQPDASPADGHARCDLCRENEPAFRESCPDVVAFVAFVALVDQVSC